MDLRVGDVWEYKAGIDGNETALVRISRVVTIEPYSNPITPEVTVVDVRTGMSRVTRNLWRFKRMLKSPPTDIEGLIEFLLGAD